MAGDYKRRGICCLQPILLGARPLGGGRTGMGAGGSPRRSGRISGVFAARPGLRGLPTAPTGGAKGGCLLVIYL